METDRNMSDTGTIGQRLLSIVEMLGRLSIFSVISILFSGAFIASVYFAVERKSYLTQIEDLRRAKNDLSEKYDLQIKTLTMQINTLHADLDEERTHHRVMIEIYEQRLTFVNPTFVPNVTGRDVRR